MRSNGLRSSGILVRHKSLGVEAKKVAFAGQNRKIVRGEKVIEADFVSLHSDACLDVKLVGGKGASLANLEGLMREKKLTDEYKTASGFCVTTVFFNRILDTEKIARIFAGATNDSELSAACTEVQNLILHSNLEDTIAPLVSLWMNKAFVQVEKGKFAQMSADRFAVRSSGVLEDGADMSAAGQNETYLGVKEEQVPLKVLACWASLFTFQSVRYRLNHGQPAVSEMGVVVQAMVNAQAAGVMFTADPITGNPFDILINANYGLGESVVSATCDPDTVKVQRSKDSSGKLRVTSRIVGQKISKVIMSDNSVGLTQEVPISDQEAENCCIDDATALKLASFGLTLVAANDGKPVDVEWAVTANEVYILQSRNITSLDLWTDEEIIHEFDAGLRTQFERLTTANVGEVTPGACSPLGLSIVMKILDNALQVKMHDRSGFKPLPRSHQILALARHRLLLNIVQIMYRNIEADIQPAFVAVDLAVFGHRVIDEELHRIAVARWGVQSGRQKLYAFAFILKLIAQSGKIITEATKLLSKYTFPLNDTQNDPMTLYRQILQELPVLQKATSYHCSMSDASSGMQIFTTLFVSEGKNPEEWDSTIFNDVAKMLSVSTDVESADIPTAIDKLATTVAQYCKQHAVTMPTDAQKALDWLQSTPELHEAYNEFMAKHGHRCIFELDLMRQSWKTEPTQFVKLLQSIVQSKSKHQSKQTEAVEKRGLESDAELVESLENPTKNMTKKILKFILPYCRSTVWNREKSKSLLVWVGNEFKKAFNRLGQLLSEQRLIPDAQLIYFLTLDEVRQIVEMRDTSARILSKAMRRRKLHPVLDKEEFPEIMTGIPRPIEINEDIELGDSIKGTPVSSGKVRGVVKVCLTVEDATELIQPGDIMLARSTDIAWSPLFPILGGVVTELGGLISHGAVVAREYGLPCIVGATGATRVFKTGETVLLDATNGVMSKVPA